RDDLVTGVQTCALPILVGLPYHRCPGGREPFEVPFHVGRLDVPHHSPRLGVLAFHLVVWPNGHPARAQLPAGETASLPGRLAEEIGRASCRERAATQLG